MKVGELFVEIGADSGKLKSELSNAERIASNSAQKMSEKFMSIGKTMTIVGGAISLISVGLIKAASNAEETASKFAVVFKDVSDEAEKTAKNLRDNFGLSSNAAKQLLSDTGDLLTGFGFTGDMALDLSTKVNELAVDLASFTNFSGGAEGASKALTKALLGERESVKSLGISILEADVQAKVLEMTQQGLTFETERQAKAYATLLIAQQQSKNAMGDFARTQDSFANQWRTLKNRINDVVVELGGALLPIASEYIGKITKIIEKVAEWIKSHKTLVDWIIKVGAILGVIAAVGGPILMAASVFIKLQGAILLVGNAIKGLSILFAASGPIGWIILAVSALWLAWETNFGHIRDFTMEVVDKIKGALDWVYDKIIWVAEKLGILDKAVSEVGGGGNVGAFGDDIGEVGSSADKATGYINQLTSAVGGLGDGVETTGEKLDEFGNRIETFDEWVKRLATETEEQNKKIAEAAEDAYKKYQDAMDPIEDRLYELTHTEEEYAARKLLRDKEVAEESIKAAKLPIDEQKKAIADVQSVYDLEINLILKKIEEKKQAEINATKQTEDSAQVQKSAIKTIADEWDTLITKIKQVGEEAEKAAKKLAAEKWAAENPVTPETEAYIKENYPNAKPIGNYQSGTPYVPKTGVYMLHKGEQVIPKNTTNESYSPVINITIQGDGDENKIRRAVEQALNESASQFYRSGYEFAFGG